MKKTVIHEETKGGPELGERTCTLISRGRVLDSQVRDQGYRKQFFHFPEVVLCNLNWAYEQAIS